MGTRIPLKLALPILLIGVGLFGASVIVGRNVTASAQATIQAGHHVTGTVTQYRNLRLDLVDVAYAVDGKQLVAEIVLPPFDAKPYQVGQSVAIYYDPDRPGYAVTSFGHSNTLGTQQGVIYMGIIGLMIAIPMAARIVWERFISRRKAQK